MGILGVSTIEARSAIVEQLRSLADSIEASGGASSVVCVVGPANPSGHPTVYVSGQDALACLMMAAATLESFIDSIPATATRL